LEVDIWKAVPVHNRLKTTRNLVRKQQAKKGIVIIYLVSWLGYSGKEDWLQKKDRKQRRPGCRR